MKEWYHTRKRKKGGKNVMVYTFLKKMFNRFFTTVAFDKSCVDPSVFYKPYSYDFWKMVEAYDEVYFEKLFFNSEKWLNNHLS